MTDPEQATAADSGGGGGSDDAGDAPKQEPKGDAPTQQRTTRPSSLPDGAYELWPVDKDGNDVGDSTAQNAAPDPARPEAVDIYFGIRTRPPPKDQADLQASIAAVLGTVRKLYCPDAGPLPDFRLYYTRLYRLGELGLEDGAAPDVAAAGLSRLVDELIDKEGARIKNDHLAKLGLRASTLCGLFVALYLLLCIPGSAPTFEAVGVDAGTAKSFMMLWTGCFVGVWLSYAIRTTALTLRDLVVADSDRLFPLTRLLFAGLLTMSFGLLVADGVVDVRIGSIAMSQFSASPSLALLLGILCGVSELTLPSAFAKRAGDFAAKL